MPTVGISLLAINYLENLLYSSRSNAHWHDHVSIAAAIAAGLRSGSRSPEEPGAISPVRRRYTEPEVLSAIALENEFRRVVLQQSEVQSIIALKELGKKIRHCGLNVVANTQVKAFTKVHLRDVIGMKRVRASG